MKNAKERRRVGPVSLRLTRNQLPRAFLLYFDTVSQSALPASLAIRRYIRISYSARLVLTVVLEYLLPTNYTILY